MRPGRFKLLEKHVVEEDGDIYLVRWRLVETPWFGVFLHHFHRGDRDRHLHDHPWDFARLVLRGGYWEHTPWGPGFTACTKFRWHGPGALIRHKATDLHHVELPAGKTAWTLVFVGRRQREWGFLTERGWVRWDEYLTKKETEA